MAQNSGTAGPSAASHLACERLGWNAPDPAAGEPNLWRDDVGTGHLRTVVRRLVDTLLYVHAVDPATALRVTFHTTEPLLEAGLIHPDQPDRQGRSFTLPTRQPILIPPGTAELRLCAPARLSETALLTLDRGERAQISARLAGRPLIPPIELTADDTAELVASGSASDVVIVRPGSARRIDAATGQVRWNSDFGARGSTNRAETAEQRVRESGLASSPIQGFPASLALRATGRRPDLSYPTKP